MASQDELLSLSRDLSAATGEGRIRWSRTADENTFRIIFDAALVKITRADAVGVGDAPDGTFVWVVLASPRGYVIDELHAVRGQEDYYQELEDLFIKARRSAFDGGKIIEQLRSEVSGLKRG